jgi:hypothetical protein
LAIGPGAQAWLTAAAAGGTSRLRRKVCEAVDLAKLHGHGAVDDALGAAARAGRLAKVTWRRSSPTSTTARR